MGERYDQVISGGVCMTPAGRVSADVGVRGGVIAAIGDLSGARARTRIDAKGLHVLPGVIDSQVHFREPGLEHKEDLQTGTASAALGGVTAVFEMPNTTPNTDSPEAMADKVARGIGRAWTDFAFFIGATPDNADRLGVLEDLPGCCGVKIFMGSSTGSLLVDDPNVLARALSSGRRRVAVHCEDEARLVERKPLVQRPGATAAEHPHWRDAQTALLATTRLLELARAARRPVHVLHVTTAAEIDLLAGQKDIATFELTPQHLTLEAPDCYERLGTLAQMNPPIRSAEHRAALWRAVGSGLADVIGSDHAPHTREEKARPYPTSPSGMPGVQTLLPLMLNHVHEGRLTLERLVDLVCHGPARIYGLTQKGRLAVGFDADLVLVDLGTRRTLRHEDMASRCGWTPFDGVEVTGFPVATLVRGNVAMRDGALVGEPIGRPVRFSSTR